MSKNFLMKIDFLCSLGKRETLLYLTSHLVRTQNGRSQFSNSLSSFPQLLLDRNLHLYQHTNLMGPSAAHHAHSDIR